MMAWPLRLPSVHLATQAVTSYAAEAADQANAHQSQASKATTSFPYSNPSTNPMRTPKAEPKPEGCS
jgi:hypothetical protein